MNNEQTVSQARGRYLSILTDEKLPIFILLGLCLVLGFFLLRDYSQSWDENYLRIYARDSLKAYSLVDLVNRTYHLENYLGPTNLRYYGPVYLIFAHIATLLIGFIFKGLTPTHLYHLVNFITFLGGVYLTWKLSRRFVSRTAALGVAILFASQPLLWGHGFINLKDVPFMTMFAWSMELGFWMIDELSGWKITNRIPFFTWPQLKQSVRQDWRRAHGRLYYLALGAAIFLFIIFLAMFLGAKPLQFDLSNFIKEAYSNSQSSGGKIFHLFASNSGSISVEAYIQKGITWFKRIEKIISLLAGICLLSAGSIRTRGTWSALARQFSSQFAMNRAKLFKIIFAGIILGFCTSVRVLGPLAGVLICLYGLWKSGIRAAAGLGIYGISAIIACYLSWPYLWPSPIDHFYTAATIMARFPNPMNVLFNGRLYDTSALPAEFLPTLFVLTLSLPVIALMVGGLMLGLTEIIKNKSRRASLLVILGWSLIPFVYELLARPPIYDNTRQFLFIYPPLFIFCGLGIEALISWISAFIKKAGWAGAFKNAAGIVLIGMLSLPGIVANVRLHPYQYAYFNSLAGGEAGAYRKYEQDYWLTSYKSAVEYLKTVAPKGSKVIVYGGVEIVAEYADPSWIVEKYNSKTSYSGGYAIISTRSNHDTSDLPDWKIIKSIGKEGGQFAVIKSLK